MVSVLTFSNDLSSNPAEVYLQFLVCKIVSKRRPGMAHVEKIYTVHHLYLDKDSPLSVNFNFS